MPPDAADQSPVETLAHKAREGDTAALHQLLEHIDADGSIRLTVRKVLLDNQAVEDVTQDVLITVVEKLHLWDPRRRFTTWLRAVARNKAIDHFRSTRTGVPIPHDIPADGRRISSLITNRDTINAAIAELPDPYREAVVLREIEELDYDEISRTLDITPATARARVSRGRALLAAALRSSREDLG